MAAKDVETTCDSHNSNGFVGNYSGGEIVDNTVNTTGLLGNNGGDQLGPESADLNQQLLGCHQACERVNNYPIEWWPGSHGRSLVTGQGDARSGREGLQLPNDLALRAGNYLGTGFNPLVSNLATPIAEFPTGDNPAGDGIYNTGASFDVNLTQPVFDGNLISPAVDGNFIQPIDDGTFIQPVVDVNFVQPVDDGNPIQPVVDVGQLWTPGINPLPESTNTPGHGVAANSPNGKPACLCGKTFSRPDSRKRHIDGAAKQAPSRRQSTVVAPARIGARTPAGLLSCMMCDRRRGADGFARRDNLRQHLEGHHNMNRESIIDYFRRYH